MLASLGSRHAASTCCAIESVPSAPRSGTLEDRFARTVLDEGLEANRFVLGREKGGEVLPLDLQARVEIGFQSTVDRLLGRAQRVGGSARELPSPLLRRGVHLARGNHLVDEPYRQRL